MVEHVATAKDCAGQAKLILTLEPLRFRVSRSRNTQPRRLALVVFAAAVISALPVSLDRNFLPSSRGPK